MAVVKYNIGYGNRYNKGVEFIMSNIHNSKFSKYYEDVKKYYIENKIDIKCDLIFFMIYNSNKTLW